MIHRAQILCFRILFLKHIRFLRIRRKFYRMNMNILLCVMTDKRKYEHGNIHVAGLCHQPIEHRWDILIAAVWKSNMSTRISVQLCHRQNGEILLWKLNKNTDSASAPIR